MTACAFTERSHGCGQSEFERILQFSFVSLESLGLNAAMIEWLWSSNRFLGSEWHFWKIIGWLGNVAFFSRFLLQWYASERRRQVVVPVSFWWLSLFGSLCLLTYALFYKQDSVFIFAYAFTWIPYIRNLVIHRRAARVNCLICSETCSPLAKFCSNCGSPLRASSGPVS